MINYLYNDLIQYLVRFLPCSAIAKLMRLSKDYNEIFSRYLKFNPDEIVQPENPIISEYYFISFSDSCNQIVKNSRISDNNYNEPQGYKYTYHNYDDENTSDYTIRITSDDFEILRLENDSPDEIAEIILKTPNIKFIHVYCNIQLPNEANMLDTIVCHYLTLTINCIYKSVKYIEVSDDNLKLPELLFSFPNVEKMSVEISFDEMVDYTITLGQFKKITYISILFRRLNMQRRELGERKPINKLLKNIRLMCPNLKHLKIMVDWMPCDDFEGHVKHESHHWHRGIKKYITNANITFNIRINSNYPIYDPRVS